MFAGRIAVMSVSELSPSTQNYVKTIWALGEWSDEPVTATLVAERIGLKLSTVSDAVRKLTEQGLVDHSRYGAIALTETGRAHAVAMVRRHRLIETFLVRVLRYEWHQVHDEAEQLEHSVSDFLVDRIDEVLDHPVRDPHGDPIPAADGVLVTPQAARLSRFDAGTRVSVVRISDTDPALLSFFAEHGLGLDSELRIEAGPPFSEAVHVYVDGSAEPLPLGRAATEAVWVSPYDAGTESAN